MLCQSCGKRKANTHVKKTINGNTEEYVLCNQCAEQFGFGNLFENLVNFGMNDFIGSFFTDSPEQKKLSYQNNRCENCGTSFEDISYTGKLGCANCYKTFYNDLIPYIKRIHGNVSHNGKIAFCSKNHKNSKEDEIRNLKEDLNKAVSAENFETAAILRDKIKELTKGENTHE